MNGANKRILVVGSANMDFIMNVKRAPEAGETVVSYDRYEYVPGGKGANAAVAAARLGADVMFATRLGNDRNGEILRQVYESCGIAPRYIKTDKKHPTGLAGIVVEKNGSNRIITFPGANTAIDDDDLEEAFMCYPDALFMQFEIADDIILKAVKTANENKIPVFIDAGPAKVEFPFGNLGALEVFSPNETETYAYTGISPINAATALHACIKLRNKIDAKYIVLKLGSRGALVYDGVYSEIIPPYENEVVDTTAAGDAFTAALTYEYIKSGDIIRAAKFANVVGSIVVSRAGAYPSLPTADEVARFIQRKNIIL